MSAPIRFDTSNTGDPATTKGEADCAQWVGERLRGGRLSRPNTWKQGPRDAAYLFARLAGRRSAAGAPC